MKKWLFMLIIVASALIVMGLSLMCISFAIWGFDIKNVSLGGTYEIAPNDHPIWGEFQNIEITTSAQDIFILPSSDGTARVVADETQKMYATVEISGDTLKIKYMDARMWFEYVGIQTTDMNLTLYLPEGAYNDLKITTASGDITIPDGFTFADMDFDLASGSLHISGIDSPAAALNANSASGDIEFGSCTLGSVTLNTVSGEIALDGCIFDSLDIDTSSGDVELYMFDAAFIDIDTASGEVESTLMSDKSYFIKTASGNVHTPPSVSGAAECHINTASGNITVSIVGK